MPLLSPRLIQLHKPGFFSWQAKKKIIHACMHAHTHTHTHTHTDTHTQTHTQTHRHTHIHKEVLFQLP